MDRHSDSYERWGDYFSIQNMYDQGGQVIPSEVWMAGFYGDGPQQNRTYIAQVFGNDTIVAPHPDGGRVYPNPSLEGNNVTVEFNLEDGQEVQAQLFFENGQYIQNLASRLMPEGPAEIYVDLTGLSQGTYIIRIQGSKGFNKVEKIVKI